MLRVAGNITEKPQDAHVVSLDDSAALAEVIFHRGDGKRIDDFKKVLAQRMHRGESRQDGLPTY